MTKRTALYRGRTLVDGYPGLEQLGVERYSSHQIPATGINDVLTCLQRLVALERGSRAATVVGCGPIPTSIQYLVQQGFEVTGIEPLDDYVRSANAFLHGLGTVVKGAAEALPLPMESQRIMVMENLLEHVDSPMKALSEAFRVLLPGGVLYVYTSNRRRFSILGRNGEFNVPFYNWLPRSVRESYVFEHLHYRPALANYSPRPAVHWFTYADLCELGRHCGFAQFYSPLDLIDPDAPSKPMKGVKRIALRLAQRSVWLRALALLQFGNAIFMWKRVK